MQLSVGIRVRVNNSPNGHTYVKDTAELRPVPNPGPKLTGPFKAYDFPKNVQTDSLKVFGRDKKNNNKLQFHLLL